MKRAALYARFSSELQNLKSVDDQLDLCRAYCAREGYAVVAEHGDRALSGASTHGRHGLAALLADVEAGRCDVVVVEALDRISRSMGDLDSIWQRFQYAGVTLLTLHEGVADQIQVGVRGLVGALYLTDLRHKTRRGLAAKVATGMRAGGLPYGYKATLGKPGQHTIDEDEAAIVRRIFREYLAGASPRSIAHGLNAARIAPHRGAVWNASTITGNAKRHSGMLSNEVYRGVIVWNRVSRVKHPATGKRMPRTNPVAEWQRVEAPQLRIVAEDLWDGVQAAIAGRRNRPTARKRGSKRLLSGLLKCALCGGSIVSVGSDHGRPVGRCARVQESHSCSNTRRVYLDTVEAEVIARLTAQLNQPELLGEYLRAYHAERTRLAGDTLRTRAADARRLAELQRKVTSTVRLVIDGDLVAREVKAQLADMEAEIDRLTARLAEPETKVVALHPQAVSRYVALLADIGAALRSGDNEEAIGELRKLIARIVVYPREPGAPMRFDIIGTLAPLMEPSVGTVVPPGGIGRTHRTTEPLFTVRCTA